MTSVKISSSATTLDNKQNKYEHPGSERGLAQKRGTPLSTLIVPLRQGLEGREAVTSHPRLLCAHFGRRGLLSNDHLAHFE